jgi:biopolymer transport protein ExbD
MAFMNAGSAEHADKSEINITPLVDVMLVLLIIFLVAAPIMVRQIDLPLQPGPPQITPIEPTVIRLSIDAGGEVLFEGQALGMAALDRVLRMEGSALTPRSCRSRCRKTQPTLA